MSELFRKVLIHNGRARKTYYMCKCLVKGEPSITPELQEGDREIVCNIKLSTFKGLIRHLVKKHKIYLPNSIVCESCEIVLPNTCLAIQHYKEHLQRALNTFNYEDESEYQCESCKTNKNLIKMIRNGVSCQL